MTRAAPALVLVGLLVGCGSKTKSASTTATDANPVAEPTVPTEPSEPGATCEPGRCLADISKVVQSRRADARACYDAGLVRKPGLAGKVVINFRIDPEGTVVEASQGMQDGQIEDAEIVACIESVVKELKFAKSADGRTTRAYHRYDFTPP